MNESQRRYVIMKTAEALRRNVLREGIYGRFNFEKWGIFEICHGVPMYRAERSNEIAAQSLEILELVEIFGR